MATCQLLNGLMIAGWGWGWGKGTSGGSSDQLSVADQAQRRLPFERIIRFSPAMKLYLNRCLCRFINPVTTAGGIVGVALVAGVTALGRQFLPPHLQRYALLGATFLARSYFIDIFALGIQLLLAVTGTTNLPTRTTTRQTAPDPLLIVVWQPF